MSNNAYKCSIGEAVEGAMETTLEIMAFEQAIPADLNEENCCPKHYWATIPLTDPKGSITIVLCEAGAKYLLDAIHGPQDDETLSIDIFYDTLSEVINTIAGRFLHDLIPDDRSFSMGLPKTGSGDGPSFGNDSQAFKYYIDDHMVTVTVVGNDF